MAEDIHVFEIKGLGHDTWARLMAAAPCLLTHQCPDGETSAKIFDARNTGTFGDALLGIAWQGVIPSRTVVCLSNAVKRSIHNVSRVVELVLRQLAKQDQHGRVGGLLAQFRLFDVAHRPKGVNSLAWPTARLEGLEAFGREETILIRYRRKPLEVMCAGVFVDGRLTSDGAEGIRAESRHDLKCALADCPDGWRQLLLKGQGKIAKEEAE